MSDLDRFKKLSQEVEDAKIQSGILKGKISMLSDQIRKCGFKNSKDAKRKIPKLKKKIKKDKNSFNSLLLKFKNKYFEGRIND